MSTGDPYNFNNTVFTVNTTGTTSSGNITITTTGAGGGWQQNDLYRPGYYVGNDNSGLIWNIANYKNSIQQLSELLKDGLTKQIILCGSKEECKEKFGTNGLEILESLLGETLQAAMKSEEAFLKTLSKEQEKMRKLREILVENFDGSELN